MKTIAISLSLALTLAGCAGGLNREGKDKNQAEKGSKAASSEAAPADESRDATATGESGDQARNDVEESGSLSLTDEEQDAVESQVEEALGGTGAESDDMGGSASLSAARQRNCTENDDGSVLVHIERSASGDGELHAADKSLTGSFERSFKRDRKWSKDGGELHCNVAKTGVQLAFNRDALDGMKLESTFSRKVDRQGTSTLSGEAKNAGTHFEASGLRSFELQISGDETQLTVEHTVTLDVKRRREFTRADGTQKVIESAVKTLEGEPLVIVRERRTGHLVADKVNYKSGRLGVLLRNGDRVEITIDDVVIDRSQGVCKRRSGTITGQITKAGEDQPSKTFTIDFDQDRMEIVQANGETKTIQPDICQ